VNIVDGVMIFLMYVLLMRVTKRSYFHYNPLQTFVGLLYFGLAFQWYDCMQSSDFLMNYVWPSVGSLFVINQYNRSSKLSKWQLALVSIVSVFVAWMHESFGSSLLAYSFVLLMLGDKRCRKSRTVILLGLSLGLAITVFSPGTLTRADGAVGTNLQYIIYKATRLISELWPLWLSVLLTLYMRKKIGSKRFRSYIPLIAAIYAGAFAGTFISVMCLMFDRALWPVCLYSGISVMVSVDALQKPKKLGLKWLKMISAIAVCAYAAWFVQLARWQWRFSNEEKDVHQLIMHSTVPIVYYDLTDDYDVPAYLMSIVTHEGYQFGVEFNVIAIDYFGHLGMIVLPTKYRGVPLRDIKFNGNSNICGVWPFLYSYDNIGGEEYEPVKMTFGGPCACVSPLNRILMLFSADTVVHEYKVHKMPTKDFEGSVVNVCVPERMGRLNFGRKVLRIDAIE
jgi:hypothetical protein